MIQINLLYSKKERLPVCLASLKQLDNISPENKKKIKLKVLCNETDYEQWKNNTNQLNLDVEVCPLSTDDYIPKINLIFNKSIEEKNEHCCKWDDDVYLSSDTWDGLINNISVLDFNENLLLSPILTNGVPSVDYFVEDYLLFQERKELEAIFIKDSIPEVVWGQNYSRLKKYIDGLTSWNSYDYWKEVQTVQTVYRGVHPVRFSYEANMYIAELIKNNKSRFYDKKEQFLSSHECPYFCNNLFFIKSDRWKTSFETHVKDGYDELPLNIHLLTNKYRAIFLRNSFGIHMAYGCTTKNREIEDYYINNIIK